MEWNQEEDMMLTVEDLKKVLAEAGADEETIEEFEDIWDEKFARTEKLKAKKIVDEKKLRVETDGAVINVKPSGLSKVTVETVAGTKYLTIEIAGRTEVNGVQTTIMPSMNIARRSMLGWTATMTKLLAF